MDCRGQCADPSPFTAGASGGDDHPPGLPLVWSVERFAWGLPRVSKSQALMRFPGAETNVKI